MALAVTQNEIKIGAFFQEKVQTRYFSQLKSVYKTDQNVIILDVLLFLTNDIFVCSAKNDDSYSIIGNYRHLFQNIS